MADKYVYQIVNVSQEQILFGITDLPLIEVVTRLAKDPKSPAVRWKQGDAIHWRPLTLAMPEDRALVYLSEFEKGQPPNGYRILRTLPVPEPAAAADTQPKVPAVQTTQGGSDTGSP